MADKLHDVVKLLLARMESHPEEFARGASRWWMMEGVLAHCSEEEREALHAGLRPIRLQQLHADVMDELLNGDERRRKEEAEHEYERQLMQQAKSAKAVLLSQQQSMMSQQQALSASLANTVGLPSTLNLGGETLTGDLIKKLKKAAGL